MTCLILGTGYVGKYYLNQFPQCLWTSRRETINDIVSSHSHIQFDLKNKQTWENISQYEFTNVLWSFPVASNQDEETKSFEFYNAYLKNKNVIVYSSTSAYVSKIENELVDETYPIRLDEIRFRSEEKLRESGAMIVHLSGIIGPERYPKSWYERNLVKFGQNVLNYIHVNDIVKLTSELFQKFVPGERFNLTSADYKTHREIATLLNLNPNFVNNSDTNASKKVENKKVLTHLNLLSQYEFIKYPQDCLNN